MKFNYTAMEEDALDITSLSIEMSDKIRKSIAKHYFNLEDIEVGQRFVATQDGHVEIEFDITNILAYFDPKEDQGFTIYLEGKGDNDAIELQFSLSLSRNNNRRPEIQPLTCWDASGHSLNPECEIKIIKK